MTEHPSQRTVHDGAMALIAAGNTIESVAGVFGVPMGTLREWVAQPAAARPDEESSSSAPARAWLRFPGTVVYPTGSNWAIIAAALVATVIITLASGWPLAFRPHPRPVLIAVCAVIAAAFIAGAIQAIRAARANCFEMRPDAVARYTLAGCIVLPYADIVGLTAVPGKGYFRIRFLARTGLPMTIHPTFSQLDDDERLWTWLQAVPKPDGSSIWRLSDVWTK